MISDLTSGQLIEYLRAAYRDERLHDPGLYSTAANEIERLAMLVGDCEAEITSLNARLLIAQTSRSAVKG